MHTIHRENIAKAADQRQQELNQAEHKLLLEEYKAGLLTKEEYLEQAQQLRPAPTKRSRIERSNSPEWSDNLPSDSDSI